MNVEKRHQAARALLERAAALLRQATDLHEMSYRIGAESTQQTDMRRCQAMLEEFTTVEADISQALLYDMEIV